MKNEPQMLQLLRKLMSVYSKLVKLEASKRRLKAVQHAKMLAASTRKVGEHGRK